MQQKITIFWLGLLGCLLLGTSGSSNAEWVEWVLEPEAEYRYEDNLNLSAFDEDEESGSAWTAGVEGGRFLQMGDRTRLRLTAGIEGSLYNRWDNLNNVAYRGSAVLTHKFGLGPDVIWISPYLTVGYHDVKSHIRTGSFTDIGISAGKRLTERFDMSASLAYNKGTGNDGVLIVPGIGANVFDQDHWTLALQGNFLITNRLILLGEISHFDGDFISSCTPSNVGTVLSEEKVKAITLDDVFGGCVYRIGGTGNSASLDLSYATSRHSSLNFGVSYLKGKGNVLKYQNTVFRASFMYSY
jgi:hypothetical protein